MPLYIYQCKCGYILQEYRSMGKRNWDTKCPKCKKLMERLIGDGSSFNLKGKGFYKEGWQ